MLHHQANAELLRYSSLCILSSMVGRGLEISLAIEARRRHLAIVQEIPEFSFLVADKNNAMQRFMERGCRPAIDSVSKLLTSLKSLESSTPAEAPDP